MPRRLVVSYAHRNNVVAQAGDSQTDNYTLMVQKTRLTTEVLAASLRALGGNCRAKIYGVSGQTSTQGLARIAEVTRLEIPAIAIVAYGVNDPGNGISQATTQANIEAICDALKAAGVTRIIVLGAPYLNYSSGGDTTSTPFATYVPVRAAQAAAATARNTAYAGAASVVFCDLYTYLRNRIVAGTTTQGDWAAWHVADLNQHFNVPGHALVAAALLATIQAQPASWLDALKAA